MSLFIDGKETPINEKDWASFHGSSVFTTLRSKDKELLHWPLHWQRLRKQAAFLGYQIPKESEVRGLLQELSIKNDQKLRVIISSNHFAITSEPFLRPLPSIYFGVKVFLSSIMVHPDLGHLKTGNSLPYFLALEQARKNDAFEGLLLDKDGFLVDGSRTSLFMIKQDSILALKGGLDGTMREAAMDWAKQHGVSCQDVMLKPHEIDGPLLLANSLLGVVPVDKIKCALSKALVERFRMD